MGLGPLAAVSLADARKTASDCRALLAKNVNPIELRREEQRKLSGGRSFGEVAKQLHEARRASWKNKKFEKQWLTSLERYCRTIWSKAVETIGTDDLLAILQPIWTTKAETASRTRGRIEAVLDDCPNVRSYSAGTILPCPIVISPNSSRSFALASRWLRFVLSSRS
jgi:hypothetical protein